MVKPSDLPEFGSIDEKFFETPGSVIIVPKSVDANSPLEELETPDQLEERQKNSGVSVTEREYPAPVTKKTKATKKTVAKKAKVSPKLNLKEKHPNWLPSNKFQIKMCYDLLKLCEVETASVTKQMENIEILLQEYPLLSSIDDLQEFRGLALRKIQLSTEKSFWLSQLISRQEIEAQTFDTPTTNTIPEKKGFFRRIFNGLTDISVL